MTMKIDSPANEKVKQTVKLLSSAKARRETARFVLEGVRLTTDAVKSGVKAEWIFYTAAAMEKCPQEFSLLQTAAASSFAVSGAVMDKLSDTENGQGFVLVCRKPARVLQLRPGGTYIALENIQDPANLGAVCRTAEALGISGAILCGCCDVYNPKAQRAAMGSLLRLELLLTDDLCGVLRQCSDMGLRLFSTTPDASATAITAVDFSGGSVAVIGNEGNGVRAETAALCTPVTIPMLGRAESLNASMAAAITMWEMLRGQV